MRIFAKSPTEMRRETEARLNPKLKKKLPKPGPVDPEKRPMLDRANFAAYLRTGRAEGSQS